MKNLLTFLILCLFTLNCFAKDIEKLPEIPWRAIVDMHNSRRVCLWKNEVNIKLFGNFDSSDSAMVENAIKKLNGITESIQLKLTNLERGNFEIYFLDSTNYLDYESFITLTKDKKAQWGYSMLSADVINSFTQSLSMELIPPEFRQNYLTNTIAFALYPNYWVDNSYFEKRSKNKEVIETIFRGLNSNEREQLCFKEMQPFDNLILNEVYSNGFEEKIAIAQKQFKPFISFPKWFKANPYLFLLLPFGIFLLLFSIVYMNISKKIGLRVSNKFLLFNINGIIGVIILAIIATLYSSLSFRVEYGFFSFNRFLKYLTAGLFMAIIIGLPAINLLRVVEKLIHKNTHKKTLKIVLIFLSTGLIPFSAILAMQNIVIKRDFNSQEIEFISYVFLGSLIIAGFRALISYYFFKEKDLILENETKLSKLRELKSKAELNALHSRINPHFLYNSLNSIAGLAHDDANKTEHMALSLSKLFRYSINKEKSDWTTFNEELEMVRIYLDVEKVRFDDRLTFSVEIDRNLKMQKIPRFIIQPLVENAVKHGISKSVDGGEIKVKITKEGKNTLIIVSDSGQNFPEDLTPGFGIQSIYDKLEILYKDKFEMNFTNSPQKQVTLKLK